LLALSLSLFSAATIYALVVGALALTAAAWRLAALVR
jgi:hypothetical protein